MNDAYHSAWYIFITEYDFYDTKSNTHKKLISADDGTLSYNELLRREYITVALAACR